MSVNQATALRSILSAGYMTPQLITTTLQGSIWRAFDATNNCSVVIKATSKILHKHSLSPTRPSKTKSSNSVATTASFHIVKEDIKTEAKILKYLTCRQDASASDTFTKYLLLFESQWHYFLVQEDGGQSLFAFVLRIHQYLKNGTLDIGEWHNVAQAIWDKMVEAVEFIHALHICHYDISLENFLIRGFQIVHSRDANNAIKTKIALLNLQIKLCDFGLSVYFGANSNFLSSKHCGKAQYISPEVYRKDACFNAKQNDIWSLGVCLFKMMIGVAPWTRPSETDAAFKTLLNARHDQIAKVLATWKKTNYANAALVNLFAAFFKKKQNERITIAKIKQCPFVAVTAATSAAASSK